MWGIYEIKFLRWPITPTVLVHWLFTKKKKKNIINFTLLKVGAEKRIQTSKSKYFANILIGYRDDWWKKNRNKNEMLTQALSREDGQPLSGDNLKKGVQLLLECNKKSYPVTVIKVEDKTINQSGIMIYNNYKFNVLLYYLQK